MREYSDKFDSTKNELGFSGADGIYSNLVDPWKVEDDATYRQALLASERAMEDLKTATGVYNGLNGRLAPLELNLIDPLGMRDKARAIAKWYSDNKSRQDGSKMLTQPFNATTFEVIGAPSYMLRSIRDQLWQLAIDGDNFWGIKANGIATQIATLKAPASSSGSIASAAKLVSEAQTKADNALINISTVKAAVTAAHNAASDANLSPAEKRRLEQIALDQAAARKAVADKVLNEQKVADANLQMIKDKAMAYAKNHKIIIISGVGVVLIVAAIVAIKIIRK